MKTNLLFLGSFVAFVIGYIFTNATDFNLCVHDQYACREIFNNLGDPIFYGAGALAIVFLVLLFFKKAFSAWKKFAIWFVPLAALLFIFYPDPGSGDLFSPYPETVFQWVSILYIIISLVIITIVSLRKR